MGRNASACRATPTLERIDVDLLEAPQILILLAMGVAVVGWGLFRALCHFILNCWGTTTRGHVTRSVKKDYGEGGVMYVVLYEFAIASGSGTPRLCAGRQTVPHAFAAKEVVAVRFWPRWPRISRISDPAMEGTRMEGVENAVEQNGRLGHVPARGRKPPLDLRHLAAACRNVPVTFR